MQFNFLFAPTQNMALVSILSNLKSSLINTFHLLFISIGITAAYDIFCLHVSWNKTLACNTIGHTTTSGSKNIADILRILCLVTCNLFAASTMFANSETK